jgi:hypothetical protein
VDNSFNFESDPSGDMIAHQRLCRRLGFIWEKGAQDNYLSW